MRRWGCLVAVAALVAGGAIPAGASVIAYAEDGNAWLTTPDGSRQHQVTSPAAGETGTDHATGLEQPQTRWAHTVLPQRPGRQPARPRCKRSEIAFGAPGEMRFCHPFRVSTFKAPCPGRSSLSGNTPGSGMAWLAATPFTFRDAVRHARVGPTAGRAPSC
jgi:hypothetical protein